MKRRRFFVALAVLLPLALFGAAKWAGRWRPVVIGQVVGANAVVQASDRHLVLSCRTGDEVLFDLQTGETRRLVGQVLSSDGAWLCQLTLAPKPQLALRPANTPASLPLIYELPALTADEKTSIAPNWSNYGWVRASPARDTIELFFIRRYCRWQQRLRRLERSFIIDYSATSAPALSHDGNFLISASFGQISIFSARSGQLQKEIALQGASSFESTRPSPFGLYALYDAPGKLGPSRFNVVNTQTGRALWQFEVETLRDWPAFSLDETLLALPLSQRKIWQIREPRTGKVLRTLALVPGTHGGAFSPDNSTLYSVANGVLYRQRAR